IRPCEQDHNAATLTKILTKEDGRIDWLKSAVEIERQVRAFDPWPGAWTVWSRGGKEIFIKILEARVGTIRHSEGALRFARGQAPRPKNLLEIPREVYPERSRRARNDEGEQNDEKGLAAGTVSEAGIITGDDLIEPMRLQLAGKRSMPWLEFLRGHKDFVGSVLK
ncbi:hypothetical protein HY442_02135, partial [Candidatus Parcubacteria bacterium]|nr:hypothetical protein [Candidatus Parcubacteria bacterium]